MSAQFQRPTGSLSARIKGAEIIFRERQDRARKVAGVLPDKDSQRAASLRGKAQAYGEAAELLARIDRGSRLGFRRWTRKDRRSQQLEIVIDAEPVLAALRRRKGGAA